jgi:hypothetical protein
VLGTPAAAPSHGRWPLVASAVAAGFTIGVALSGWVFSDGDQREPDFAMAPAEVESQTDVFAAGTAPRSYPLPGGGTLTLEPGSIVDTVSRGNGALKLRLVRGEATIVTPTTHSSAHKRNLALLVGNAELTPAGNVRVRHSGGATAMVQVLDGTATISAPDAEPGKQDMLIRPGDDTAVVPIRVITASVDPQRRVQSAPQPLETDHDEPLEEEAPKEAPVEAVVAGPTPWVVACNSGDDVAAVKLFNQSGQSLASVSGELKECLEMGLQMLGTPDIAAWEATANGSGSDARRMLAARDLVKHYNKAGETEKSQHYQALYAELNKGQALFEEGLCNKIQAEDAAGNSAEVVRLGQNYLGQFPDGPCTVTVNTLLAKHAQPEEEDEADAADSANEGDGGDEAKDDENDPYTESKEPSQ